MDFDVVFQVTGYPTSPMFGQGPVLRRTPVQDMYLNEKHRMIYPSDRELDSVQHTVRMVELALKEVADEISDGTRDNLAGVKTEPGLMETTTLAVVKTEPGLVETTSP